MNEDYILTLVPNTLIPMIWDEVEPIIQRVVDVSDGDISTDTVKRSLLRIRSLLVVVTNEERIVALFTLEVRTMDTGKRVLYSPIIAGDNMSEWLEYYLNYVRIFARQENCPQIRGVASRKGWLKLLKKRGLKEGATTVSYTL